MITRIKGTYDLFDTKALESLTHILRESVTRNGYQEVITPILEPLELFIRSLGDQTDVVSKEMYRAVGSAAGVQHEASAEVALRPELTASIMRAVVQEPPTRLPLKLFSIGPCFRYERPQKGRLRQFTQASIEVIGSLSIAQDALFIRMLDTLFMELLSGGYVLVINFLGTPADRTAHRTALVQFLQTHEQQLCATCQTRMHTNPLRVFDCKNPDCQKLYEQAPVITNYLGADSRTRWTTLQELLHDLGVSYIIQPKLVRGLDYYTDTVFEFVATDGLGAQNTFCGGGRYERLALELGAREDLPSLGAGIGIERLLMLVQDRQQGKPATSERAGTCVIPLSTEQKPLALHVTVYLLQHGMMCDTLLDDQSIKSMFKYADARAFRFAIILGEQEQIDGTATVKDLLTGNQTAVKQADLVKYLQEQAAY
jgi:histidyl-tRNA synthetase